MLRIVLRRRAEADLLSISEYSKAKWGDPQARRYIEDLRRQVEFAAEFPGVGSHATGLPAEYRKVRSGSHRVIYRCTESELIVVRVIHERVDVPDEGEDF
ncbi:MAG TPA: type II toxin-antitoxin system RelE/ParE family toxin [Croceibacterium sp.]|nr:type II toxin-antitoxin system RelE/ParE family toxin [Croceibacterium sp.]